MNTGIAHARKPTASVVMRFVIWAIFLIGGTIVGIMLDLRDFHALFLNPWWHLAMLPIGLLLMRLVFSASTTTGRALARFGRDGDIPRFETNRLVTAGPYACMRHPMHLGLLFMPLAFALVLGSPSFILIIAPLEMLFMLGMIMLLEEREAIAKFGDAYRHYQARVPAFNLRPSCLKKLFHGDPV